MKRLINQQEKRRCPRYLIELPLEYWKTDNACRGGLVCNVSKKGLCIYSVHDMPVGGELEIRVFFPNEYEFDGFRVRTKIVWKEVRYETDWKGYQYGLEFVQIPAEDDWKLFYIINGHLKLEEISSGEGVVFGNLSSGKTSPPPLSNLAAHPEERSSGNDLWQRLRTKFLHLS
ncbi:MAG: hypothetical protein A2162_06730 [Deltaproteobacteria bacterium RBG_13_52_11b]|nr:MAG: hypothetical protein A2162_06730 [Deltaproteobacteria bacterium RBG_13_52_11b]